MTAHWHVVLDTSAYSHLGHGHRGIAGLVATAEVITMPVIVVGELEAGFAAGRHGAANQQALNEFLTDSAVRVLDVTRPTARLYARIFAHLRTEGTPVSPNDMWIAAATMECGGHLLTFDSDFMRIPGLEHTLLEA